MISRKVSIDKIVLFFLLVTCLFFSFIGRYNNFLICLLIMAVELYVLFKVRKNKLLLFMYLCIIYFDYSVIFGKYLGQPIQRLSLVYQQIPPDSEVRSIGLMCLLLFQIVIALLLPKIKKDQPLTCDLFSSSDSVSYIVTAICAVMVLGYLFLNSIIDARTIYEYAIIMFCIGFYITKHNILCRSLLISFMVISTLVNMYQGGRIISLMPMIAYFVIYIIHKIKSRTLLVSFISVVVLFTFFGLYGDLIEANSSSHSVTITDLKNTMVERKFTLDTAVSSHWTSLTEIAVARDLPVRERAKNGVDFLTKYTLLGKKANYTQIYDISLKYFTHYYGGFIQGYFYYWFGYLGVLMVALYISFFIRMINGINKKSYHYTKILAIYVLATIPRWYLYYPTILFRGILLLTIVYFAFVKLLKPQNKV